MTVTFSIIVPTIGRTTLGRTLRSIIGAGAQADDQVLVVGDSGRPPADRWAARRDAAMFMTRLQLHYIEAGHPESMAGAHQRNVAQGLATGSHLLFLDDDDVYTPGALAAIRRHVTEEPEEVHVHKMRAASKRFSYTTLWLDPVVRMGNIGTPMFCVPNWPSLVGEWPLNQYCNDISFMEDTLRRRGSGFCRWHHDIVADIY